MRASFFLAALMYPLAAMAASPPVSFNAPRTYPVYRPFGLVTGDFDGDGEADIAVNSGGNAVTILLSNGKTHNYSITTGVSSESLVTGDFNRDGNLDLALAGTVTNVVTVMLGNGDGTFQAPVSYAVGACPWAVAVGDVNGDGKPDLAASNFNDGTVSVLLGNGDGTFQPAVAYNAGGWPRGVVTADFNQDGKLDLAVTVPFPTVGVAVLLGNGDGTFQPPIVTATVAANVLVAGDFDGNGAPDLAVLGTSVMILSGIGDGTFTQKGSYPLGSGPKTLTIGDFNGDGKLDLAAGGDAAYITVLLGNGDATFQAKPFGPFTTAGLASGDFNGDGKLDLASIFMSGGNGNDTGRFPSCWVTA